MGQIASILDCERVRGSVSASVDGELSEVEAAGLEAHLASCESCRLYAADSAETARLLRGAPLEQLGFTIALPSRFAVARQLQVAAAAAAIAATVGLSAVVGTLGSARTTSGDAQALAGASEPIALRNPEAELKLLQRATGSRSRLAIHARQAL
ncbi:MAG: zf-HC2 domain-containing protein [Actinobacteria bacterium]|nr:zf-HC2 domain-containing protein [Actinomycetota bacterium]